MSNLQDDFERDRTTPATPGGSAGAQLFSAGPGVRAATCQSQERELAAGSPEAEVPAQVGLSRPTRPDQGTKPSSVVPAACGCGCGAPQLVYALGQLGFDYGTEARRDAIQSKVAEYFEPTVDIDVDVDTPEQMAKVKGPKHAFVASNITWTLNFDTMPVYAIRPQGPFAGEVYEVLRVFLKQQEHGAERVAIPGQIMGQARLLNGQVVPVIQPERMGLANWKTQRLSEAVQQHLMAASGSPRKAKADDEEERQEIGKALDRIYHEFRNLGITPQDRALNFAATNALMASGAIVREAARGYKLDRIEIVRSPICRPESDCWDVTMSFFHPSKRLEVARCVSRICVDVSDVLPVCVGKERCWHIN